jgi:hypothetical protein
MIVGAVDGSMRLTFIGMENGYAVYDVSDVEWRFGSEHFARTLRGVGTYRIGGDPVVLHRMELDLSMDGEPPQHYDSEFQPPESFYPELDIVVDINNQFCWDTVVRVSAVRARAPGDLNCDGAANNFDIDPFVLAVAEPARYLQEFPDCNLFNADVNGDGQVNNFDIDPFVELLTGG